MMQQCTIEIVFDTPTLTVGSETARTGLDSQVVSLSCASIHRPDDAGEDCAQDGR